jgi:hypothetical protein
MYAMVLWCCSCTLKSGAHSTSMTTRMKQP